MALPWLIGGAIVGGIALASKLSGGSSNNNNDYDNDREDEIRRQAEKERKKRSLTERLESISSEVELEGKQRAVVFQNHLDGSLNVKYDDYDVFAATLNSRGELNEKDDSLEEYIDFDEDILPCDTQDNLESFVSLYNVDNITPSSDFQEILKSQAFYQDTIAKLDERLEDLLSLHETIADSDDDFEHLEDQWDRIDDFREEGFSFSEEVNGDLLFDFSDEAK